VPHRCPQIEAHEVDVAHVEVLDSLLAHAEPRLYGHGRLYGHIAADKNSKQRAAMEECKVRTPMQDGGINARCEHQCKQQWTEMATDEN